jgi:hypothetical protein
VSRLGANMKTQKELEKLLRDTKRKLSDDKKNAADARTHLHPEIEAYRAGAIWAIEFALGKRG